MGSWFAHFSWRWMFAPTATPSVLFFLGLLLVPESPRRLLKNGRAAEAERTLARIGGQAYANVEIHDVETSFGEDSHQTVRCADLLDSRLRKVLALGIVLACFILTYTFPILDATLGASGVFWLYGGICVLGGMFVLVRLPETNGRTLEEIEHDLTGQSPNSNP